MSTLKTSKPTRFLIWLVGIVLALHLAVSLFLIFFQNDIIFQRKPLAEDYIFTFHRDSSQAKLQEYYIKVEDKDSLNALLFKTTLPSKGLILYFHGNADNLQRWGRYAEDFTKLGYDILMIDYRGYGKSSGEPLEKNLYTDALAVYQWSEANLKPSRYIFYGRSLGSAVASNLATAVTPYLLILETPFDELKGAVYEPVKPFLYFLPLHSSFSNKSFLPKVKCKKIIIHGTNDQVVPLSSAMRLKPLLEDGDQFIVIEGGSHRNLRDFQSFHQALAEMLE